MICTYYRELISCEKIEVGLKPFYSTISNIQKDMTLPKFFMIYKSNGYKFYKNCIMFPSGNSYNPVNVVTPLMNATIRAVKKYTRIQNQFDGVLSRDTLARMYSFKCKFTGYEATIILDGSRIIVPGVYFSDCDNIILPKGSPILIPPTNIVQWSSEARPYLEADVVVEDPTPSAPILASVPSAPPADPTPLSPPVAVTVTDPTATNSVYPPHIKQLILADSIQKNECCAITGDPISQENACITTCGHVFTRIGLTGWLSVSSNQSCPVCRQKCSLA